jgi:regulator of RNase E activity RraA
MSLTPEADRDPVARVHRHHHHGSAQEGPAKRLDARRAPLRPGQPRLVGPAFTLRFVPAREDLATPESWSSPISTRTAIEAMPKGCIAVVDAMGVTDAGIFGDILCARMVKRGVAALVTDGVVRDSKACSAPACRSGATACRAALGRRA